MKKHHSIYQLLGDLPHLVEPNRGDLRGEEEETSFPVHPDEATIPDDHGVFLEAMKDVRQISHDNPRVPEQTFRDPGGVCRNMRDSSMSDALRDDYPIVVSHLPEYMEGHADGLNPTVMDRLRNEEFSIQRVLDLHGLSSAEAADVFSAFLETSVRNGVRCVKVIHGRGLKSKNGPVLKERLKEWLVRALHRKWVIAFCNSKMAHGGPGATLILLRSKPLKRRLNIIG